MSSLVEYVVIATRSDRASAQLVNMVPREAAVVVNDVDGGVSNDARRWIAGNGDNRAQFDRRSIEVCTTAGGAVDNSSRCLVWMENGRH